MNSVPVCEAMIPHSSKWVCVCYLCVLLAVVCGRAVLWSSSGVGVSLCCLVVLVPLLHGLLRHTHISKHQVKSGWSRQMNVCSVIFLSLPILTPLFLFLSLSLSFINYCSCRRPSPVTLLCLVFPDKLNKPFYWLSNHDSFVWISRLQLTFKTGIVSRCKYQICHLLLEEAERKKERKKTASREDSWLVHSEVLRERRGARTDGKTALPAKSSLILSVQISKPILISSTSLPPLVTAHSVTAALIHPLIMYQSSHHLFSHLPSLLDFGPNNT